MKEGSGSLNLSQQRDSSIEEENENNGGYGG